MTTNTRPKPILDGLLTCAHCGGHMVFKEGQQPRYACRTTPANGRSECRTPGLHAGRTDDLIIGTVLQAVLTERNITTAVDAANEPPPGDDAPEYRITGEEIQELKVRPDHFVQAVGGTAKAKDFLAGFIAEIKIHPGKGVIHYSIPLPADSALAGMSQQEVGIPSHTLAQRE